jgi:hypothetical protein
MKKRITLSFLVLGFVAQAQVMPVGFITQITSKAMTPHSHLVRSME